MEKYICMPGSKRFMIIAYTRKSGFLSKNAKVILTISDTIEGIKSKVTTSIGPDNVFYLAYQLSENMSVNQERKGPTQETLVKYREHMEEILSDEGLI